MSANVLQPNAIGSIVPTFAGGGGEGGGLEAYWKWNNVDLSQINTTPIARRAGTDGTLSVGTFSQPAAAAIPTIRHTHTAASAGGWVLYELLDDAGNPLELPARYRIVSRIGARNPGAPSGDGANSIPGIVPYLRDPTHFFWTFRNSVNSDRLDFFVSNGDDPFSTGGTRGYFIGGFPPAFTLGPNSNFGQYFAIDVLSPDPAVAATPNIEFAFRSEHSPPHNQASDGDGGAPIWSANGGAVNDPDTAWVGWGAAPVTTRVGLIFFEFAGAAGFSQIGDLYIVPSGPDVYT